MKAIHLFPILLVAMACSPAVTPEPVVVSETVDGTLLFQTTSEGSSDLVRCWPIDGKQDCVRLSFMGGGGTSYASVERRILPTVPETAAHFGPTENLVGYSCTILWSGTPGQISRVNISARISRDGTVLASSSSQAGSPMERDFVDQWETENRIGLVSKYVNCNEIARLIEQGSLETLGTAMLKYPAVIGDLPDQPFLPSLEASLMGRIPDS
jgi:hypothetical protein